MTNGIYPFEEIMEILNWSQADLAKFLGTKRSNLSMMITGLREVPINIGFRLSQLAILAYKSKDDPQYIPSRILLEKATLKQTLAARNKKCLAELSSNEKRLVEMESKYKHVLASIKRLIIMDVTTVKLELNEKLVLEEMKFYWEAQLTKCNLSRQHTLRLRIQSLKQEIALNTKVSAK